MAEIYSIDVQLYATAYVRAESPEAALKLARECFGTRGGDDGAMGDFLEQGAGDDGWRVHGGSAYLPDDCDVALSPAVTFHGPDPDAVPEYVEDDEAEE